MSTKRRTQSGVTLAELAVVLAILAVLTVLALPSAVDMWRRETVILLADRFASAVSLARTTAASRHVWVHLGPRDAAQDWTCGWALYTSKHGPPATPGSEDVLVSVSPPTLPAVDFAFESSQTGVNTLSYAPVGYSRTSQNNPSSGTLTISSGPHVRRVRINMAGRARVCNPDTDASCNPGAGS